MGKVTEIVLLVITIVSFGLTLVANYVFGLGEERFGLNFVSVGDVSDIYITNITPSGWTFSIWGAIYVWQALWLAYFLTLLCRKTKDGKPLHPAVGNVPAFYGFYIANLCFNIAWIFLWCLEYVQYALIFIILVAISLWVALGIALYGLTHQAQELTDGGNRRDVWLHIVFLQNGICIYATWVTIASAINFNIVLVYFGDLSMDNGSTLALFCLTVALGAWFILEVFVFEKPCRYCFMVYVVVIFALSGSIDKNWKDDSANSIITAIIIAAAGVLLILKVVRAIYHEKKNPLYVTGGARVSDEEVNEAYTSSNVVMEKL